MHAQAFIAELAPKIGVPESELTGVDRALAVAELRKKASGRAFPDLATKEAVRLPLAFMAARGVVRAAVDLIAVENFTPQVGAIEVKAGDYRSGLAHYGIDLDMVDFDRLTLIDALVMIARGTASEWRAAMRGLYWLKVDRSGPAYLQFMSEHFEGQITFVGAMDGGIDTMMLTRSATLNGKVISWIGHVTKDTAD